MFAQRQFDQLFRRLFVSQVRLSELAIMGGSGVSLEQLLEQADKFLCEAKNAGRNQVAGPGGKELPEELPSSVAVRT